MEEESNNTDGLKQGPLLTHKWQNSLRGSIEVHHALLHINKEAFLVIEGCWVYSHPTAWLALLQAVSTFKPCPIWLSHFAASDSTILDYCDDLFHVAELKAMHKKIIQWVRICLKIHNYGWFLLIFRNLLMLFSLAEALIEHEWSSRSCKDFATFQLERAQEDIYRLQETHTLSMLSSSATSLLHD